MRPSPTTLRPLLRHVHPELGRVTTPPKCDAAGLAAVGLFELLAMRHDGPLRGAAPEAMLSCQRDVAAMVLHDAAALPWLVIGVNDGDVVTVGACTASQQPLCLLSVRFTFFFAGSLCASLLTFSMW